MNIRFLLLGISLLYIANNRAAGEIENNEIEVLSQIVNNDAKLVVVNNTASTFYLQHKPRKGTMGLAKPITIKPGDITSVSKAEFGNGIGFVIKDNTGKYQTELKFNSRKLQGSAAVIYPEIEEQYLLPNIKYKDLAEATEAYYNQM